MPGIPKPNQRIREGCHCVLLVEGQDEVDFFDEALRVWNFEATQALDWANKYSTKEGLKALLNDSEYAGVTSFGVIRDSDLSPEGAFQSVQDAMESVGINAPSGPGDFSESDGRRVGIYTMPGLGAPGSLEDLWVQAAIDERISSCITSYLECIRSTLDQNDDNETHQRYLLTAKPVAYSYLATRPRLFARVGSATKAGLVDLDSPVFSDVRRFVTELQSS